MIKKYVVSGCILLFLSVYSVAASLSPEALSLIKNATFEVVVLKDEGVGIAYEKPLPFKLLPFAQREDKYDSIGTGFLIAPNTFVTAAHVFNLHSRVLNRDIYIRNEKKEVFKVNQILKYASDRDYVVFTCDTIPAKLKPLKTTLRKLDSPVFAVGNALGEGVVIREGLLTSETFEEVDGKWKWLRFSAAASPGNSGGPLVDNAGNVIGIVMMKSENENLNYALPIQEVLSDVSKKGSVHEELPLGLPGWGETTTKRFFYEFPLPQSPHALATTLPGQLQSFISASLKELIVSKSATFFPKSNKPNYVVQAPLFSAVYPKLIIEDENRFWRFTPTQAQEDANENKALLEKNGAVRFWNLGGLRVLSLKLPDNESVESVVMHPKRFMDLLLKGLNVQRPFGKEAVKVTSLGNPVLKEIFDDNYGRKWVYWEWYLQPMNLVFTGVSLPTPDSISSIFIVHSMEDVLPSMLLKQSANLIIQDYQGSLTQWQSFLSQKDLCPLFFNQTGFVKNGKVLDVQTSYFKASIMPDVLAVTGSSLVIVNTSFVPSGNTSVIDATSLEIRENEHSDNRLSVLRFKKPSEDIPEYNQFWSVVSEEKAPYNKQVFSLKNNVATFFKVLKIGNPKTNTVNYVIQVTKSFEEDSRSGDLRRLADMLSSSIELKKRKEPAK